VLNDKALKLLESRVDALKKRDKDKDAERKVIDEVFDHSTLLTVYKFFSDEIIDTIEFSISTGKEANVFFATSKHGPRVVKIYRISNATFKTISKYIYGDPRFRRVKGDRRRAIFTWAQKEFKNLKKALKAEARVPRPYACRNNVLVMDYIGTEEMPAPLLKDTAIEDPEEFFDDLIRQMRCMYHWANLVHCDMSEYNVLVHEGLPYIIDMGQAVLRRHPMAGEFIERDARNLSHLFKRRGVKLEPKEILERIEEPLEKKVEKKDRSTKKAKKKKKGAGRRKGGKR
jgi:RIO kinase 1